ncbi:MAG: hypothetical protein AAGB32_03785 [Pseudomonadota bacterium]
MTSHSQRPIFLHGLWRSGSTFIWSEFRKNPNTYCYLEPLHHRFSHLTKKRVFRDTPSVNKGNNHPVMEQPYFFELIPLINFRGVKNHSSRLAFEKFFLNENDTYPALEKYISTLVDHGHKENKIPVLGFNRTPFRIAWLQKKFPSWNIHLDRHPFDIWCSYETHYQKKNPTFYVHWLRTIEKNQDHPVFSCLKDFITTRTTIEKLLRHPKKFYVSTIPDIPIKDRYLMVFVIWLGTILHALTYADDIFDINNHQKDYIAQKKQNILDNTGIEVDFTGLNTKSYDNALLSEDEKKQAEDLAIEIFPLDQFTAFFDKDKVLSRSEILDPEKFSYIEKLFAKNS